MKVQTTRFGTVEIDEGKIIAFPKGIPGFEQLRRFFILPVEGNENIRWLQAVDEPAVALLVIDPFVYFKGYSCDVPDHIAKELGIKEPAEALVLATVTVPPGNPAATTANLLAPIVINTRLHKGRQVILSGSPYTTKHRLFREVPTPEAKGSSGKTAGVAEKNIPPAAKKVSGKGGV
ncbi:flagellar assembly protein FliW [Desulfallas thermosapovorans]|uniref:Flagellar assembly factor FliW n=1 Tax=Desulfallas thermosapovorans DSM 6562 TaxID=1121431 RepID=A0A5S4ZRJ4_9FIRM|nr:flagellar assembly protein FliW [Desulfallas thermosapovorans]TYO95527.1 flagellar assembly factor FliW [Desulfallas thermosapovorans DSM 6562]